MSIEPTNEDGRDQLSPHDRAIEITILQYLMNHPNEIGYAKSKIRRPGQFYILDCQYIWKAMIRLHDKGQEIHYPMVARELLRDRKEYDHIISKRIDPATLPSDVANTLNTAVDEDNGKTDLLITEMSNHLMLTVLLVPDMIMIDLDSMILTLLELAYRRQMTWNAGQDTKDAHNSELGIADLHERGLERRRGMMPAGDRQRTAKSWQVTTSTDLPMRCGLIRC